MFSSVRIAISDEDRVLVDLDDLIEVIISGLQEIPEDGILRPATVMDSMRQYKFLIHQMAGETHE